MSQPATKEFRLVTDAVEDNGFFDPRYTCDINGSSPELRWVQAPAGTVEFALIAEDLDAPGAPYCHWVVYRIPGGLSHLPVGIPPQDLLPNGIRQGLNGSGKLGYAAPCPPIGHAPHRYVFRLFALNAAPDIPHRPRSEQLLELIRPYVIGTVEVMGRYGRAIERAG